MNHLFLVKAPEAANAAPFPLARQWAGAESQCESHVLAATAGETVWAVGEV